MFVPCPCPTSLVSDLSATRGMESKELLQEMLWKEITEQANQLNAEQDKEES